MALDLSFLAGITYAQVTLEFEVERTIRVPGFAGSSFRGALGDVFRRGLCARRPPCENACGSPSTCSYYALFERSRDPAGGNAPKAMILEPPVPPGLDEIAHGAAPEPPYREVPAQQRSDVTQLVNPQVMELPPGCRIPLLATFLGPVSALAPGAVQALAAEPFPAMGGSLRLARSLDGSTPGRVLFDEDLPHYAVQAPSIRNLDGGTPPEFEGTMRIVLTTPARLVIDRQLCLQPRQIAASFLRHCLVRAIKVHDAFGPPGRQRVPWMDLPEGLPQPVRERLYHYRLPRLSHRQQAWIDFDGLLGYFDLQGRWTPDLLRLLRAVEILHVAEKATSGLGRVRCCELARGSGGLRRNAAGPY
jgi:hypothetical protein